MSTEGRQEELPKLRSELQLLQGAPSPTGAPTWLVHDPALNRFIQIDGTAYEVLQKWRDSDSADDLIQRVNSEQHIKLDQQSLEQLIAFLQHNQLTTEPRSDGWRYFANQREASRRTLSSELTHNYLFFRVPLCRPQSFLDRTLPLARALSTPVARAVVALMGVAGLYLVSRQWEEFISTFQNIGIWESAILAVLALMVVKTAHELGHAYTATHLGCRVHTMGVAFVVLAPILYTDVTDSWRLPNRQHRFLIDSAGIKVELAIAAIALFLWSFLPEGPLRNTAFLLSAVSMISSLAINLNPFMRFDGYYLLSELIGIENLQSRSFEVGRWKLRELLFGLGTPCPEDLPRRLISILIVYSWAVWVYRLLLFIGIALLVYHYFFKLLGIILFAVEIIFFIARPIANELKVWRQMQQKLGGNRRTFITTACFLVALLLCMVPWSTRVEIPAVVESAKLQLIFPSRIAKVVRLHVEHGALVRAGDPIITLTSPEIGQDLERARISLRLAKLQHARRLANPADRESSLVLESTVAALLDKIAGLQRERADLLIQAPFDGRVVDFNSELHPGRWVNPREQIAVIAADAPVIAKGYVAESDLWRIVEGSEGVFIPEEPQRQTMTVKIDQVAAAGSSQIEIAELASTNTGRIAVNLDEKRRLVPATAQYLIHMSGLKAPPINDLSVRGVVLAEGRAESLLARVWRQTLNVLLRESGF